MRRWALGCGLRGLDIALVDDAPPGCCSSLTRFGNRLEPMLDQ